MTSPLSLPGLLTLGLSLALSVALCGCGPGLAVERKLINKLTPTEPDKFAREFIEALRTGRITDAVQQLDSTLQSNEGMAGLQSLSLSFKGGDLKQLEGIGVHTFYTPDATSVNLSYQMELSTGWFTGNVLVAERPSGRKISSARFNLIPGPLEKIHAVNFARKGPGQYVFALLCGLNVVFIAGVTAMCARSRVRKKGLWIVFILFGIVTVQMNWTTGDTQLSPFSFLLLGAACFQSSSWAPWILSLGMPVGAVVFLWKRKQLVVNSPPELPPV